MAGRLNSSDTSTRKEVEGGGVDEEEEEEEEGEVEANHKTARPWLCCGFFPFSSKESEAASKDARIPFHLESIKSRKKQKKTK